METLKVVMFAIGTFFSQTDANIIADKTIFSMDPKAQSIEITEKNVIGIFMATEDTAYVKEALKSMYEDHDWVNVMYRYPDLDIKFVVTEEGLDIIITMKYTDTKDLEYLGIMKDPETGEYFIYNGNWNISSDDGRYEEERDRFMFDQNEPFSFVTDPLVNLPEPYASHKQSVLPFFKEVVK